MAIKIFCDLCESEREVNQIRGAEAVSFDTMRFAIPQMNHQHFVCLECLGKIGIPGTMIGANANLDGQDGPDGRDGQRGNPSGDARGEVTTGRVITKRRRGVEVVLTWKNNGEFEVCSSIAAAVDRIGERTGKVISGADISHALLKERVYNADGFMVKYAVTREDRITANMGKMGEMGMMGENAKTEAAAREDRFPGGNELKLEEAGA